MPVLARCYRYNPRGLGWNRKGVGLRPSENHPIQSFLFYMSGDVDEVAVTNLSELVEQLAKKRRWTIGPRQFVDSTEEPADPSRHESIRTVGAVLRVYSALPPWGDRLPPEVDRAHLEEVECVIDALVLLLVPALLCRQGEPRVSWCIHSFFLKLKGMRL